MFIFHGCSDFPPTEILFYTLLFSWLKPIVSARTTIGLKIRLAFYGPSSPAGHYICINPINSWHWASLLLVINLFHNAVMFRAILLSFWTLNFYMPLLCLVSVRNENKNTATTKQPDEWLFPVNGFLFVLRTLRQSRCKGHLFLLRNTDPHLQALGMVCCGFFMLLVYGDTSQV